MSLKGVLSIWTWHQRSSVLSWRTSSLLSSSNLPRSARGSGGGDRSSIPLVCATDAGLPVAPGEASPSVIMRELLSRWYSGYGWMWQGLFAHSPPMEFNSPSDLNNSIVGHLIGEVSPSAPQVEKNMLLLLHNDRFLSKIRGYLRGFIFVFFPI